MWKTAKFGFSTLISEAGNGVISLKSTFNVDLKVGEHFSLRQIFKILKTKCGPFSKFGLNFQQGLDKSVKQLSKIYLSAIDLFIKIYILTNSQHAT